MRTLHVALRVKDRHRSTAFYAALGYEVVGEVPDAPIGHLVMLKLPEDPFVSLELVEDTDREVGPGGLSHLVVRVDDVRATVARLAGDGIDSGEPTSPDGSQSFWTVLLTDPDDYAVELVQWPPGHPPGMTAADWGATEDRDARDVVSEMHDRQRAGDETYLDELVAVDLVNHAAGPQGREGLRQILRTIATDLGPVTLEQHRLVGCDDVVAQHVTLHGHHRASTMPLLAGTRPRGTRVSWTFLHLWRVARGVVVEHWACRDDLGLLEQVRDGGPGGAIED